MELDDHLYNQLTVLSSKGNDLADEGEYLEALDCFKKALDLVPIPKTDWEASLWLNGSIGDMYYSLKKYEQAADFFFDALNCPDGQVNSFIHLRLGESLFELGEIDKAKEHLLQVYMLEGKDIFLQEDSKFFELIEALIQ